MKSLFIAHSLLIDCGKASKQTRGLLSGPLTEGSASPWNHYNQ
jgi:hypothetical protein